MKTDYVYVYPKNWNGDRTNIICQKVMRVEKYNSNPVEPIPDSMNRIKTINNLELLIKQEDNLEQYEWLKKKPDTLKLQ